MGPWTHRQAGNSPPGTTNAGDRDFGAVSLLDTRADRAGLVRPLAEGDRQRRRARGAGQDLRDGRRRLARRAGVAARAHRLDTLLPPLGRPRQHAARRRHAQSGQTRRRTGRPLRLRPGAPGADDGRLQLLQPGDRAVGRLRPAAGRGARRRARLHHPAAGRRTSR